MKFKTFRGATEPSQPDPPPPARRVGHFRCEGVAERKCGNYFTACGGWLFLFFGKRDAEIGHLPGGFKCEFGGGMRMRKKSVSMRKFKLRERAERRKLC